jgi:hypothetical protein
MGAEAGFHADHTARQLRKFLHQGQTPYLPPQNNRAARIKADNVKHVLADIDADGRKSGNAMV